MRLCELRQKEVINTCTCRSLGCPVDLEFDRKTGAITALIVPGPGKFCFFPGEIGFPASGLLCFSDR